MFGHIRSTLKRHFPVPKRKPMPDWMSETTRELIAVRRPARACWLGRARATAIAVARIVLRRWLAHVMVDGG
eukprot:14000726-Alexandrium_andersonii.AAC.1